MKTTAMQTQCCICRRMLAGSEWVDEFPTTDMITHTYCPECGAAVMREIGIAPHKIFASQDAA